MSNAIKQILVAGAVIAISMVFIIQFRPGTNVELGGGPTCAVEISGECIPFSDFKTAYRLAAPNIDPEQLKQLRMRELVVEGLIERWMLVEDAKRLGVTATDSEVTSFIGGKQLARFSLPAAQEETFSFLLRNYGAPVLPPPLGPAKRLPVFDAASKKFDYKRYQRWVQRSTPKTEKDFKEFQRLEAIAARMRALVRSRVRVSELEARKTYERFNEKVVVNYLKLERSFYTDHVVDRSDDALDAWIGDNGDEIEESWTQRKDSFLPECRQARHLVVKLDETNPDADAAAKEAEDKAKAARQRIADGESFADVAKEVSEDGNTKAKGGDLGCFAAGKLAAPGTTKALDDAVFTLDAGGLSEVIKTQYGFHVVKVDKVRDEESATKYGKRETARTLYLRKEAEALASEASKQILAAAKDGKSLQEALDAHLESVLPEAAKEAYQKGKDGEETSGDSAWDDPARPKIRTSDPFSMTGPPFSQVENGNDAAKMLFKLAKKGDLPDDVIKLIDGYAVAQLEKREPVSDETWKEKRTEYMAGLRREKQNDAVVAYVQRLREKLGKEIVYRINLSEDKPVSSAEPGG